jgi:hypothetical protein
MTEMTMTTEATEIITPEQCDERICGLHYEIEGHARTMMEKAAEVGRLLKDRKAEIGHGRWTAHVKRAYPFSHNMAIKYMKVRDLVEVTSEGDFDLNEYSSIDNLLAAFPTKPRRGTADQTKQDTTNQEENEDMAEMSESDLHYLKLAVDPEAEAAFKASGKCKTKDLRASIRGARNRLMQKHEKDLRQLQKFRATAENTGATDGEKAAAEKKLQRTIDKLNSHPEHALTREEWFAMVAQVESRIDAPLKKKKEHEEAIRGIYMKINEAVFRGSHPVMLMAIHSRICVKPPESEDEYVAQLEELSSEMMALNRMVAEGKLFPLENPDFLSYLGPASKIGDWADVKRF